MNNVEKLKRIADYHFSIIRSTCTYQSIFQHKIDNDSISFYAIFKCKKRTIVKEIALDLKGNLVVNDRKKS